MQKERDKLADELVNKKGPGLDDLGNSQPTQIAKDTKIKRSAAEEACSRVKTEGVAGQSFARTSERSKGQGIQPHKRLFEKIKRVTHRSPQLPLQKPNRNEMIEERPVEEETDNFLEDDIPAKTLPVCTEEDRGRTEMEGGYKSSKVLQTRGRLIGLLSYKHLRLCMKTEDSEVESRFTEEALTQMAFARLDFRTAWDQWLFFFPFSPLKFFLNFN